MYPELIPGIPVRVAAGVRRIVAPNAGLMTGAGTNTYLLGEDEVAVLDPGPDDPAHLRAIIAAAGVIRWILLTHTHRDHAPLAAVLAAQTGARLIGLPAPGDGRQDLTFIPDHVPGDEERLACGARAVVAIHTPGHASNCVSYLLQSERLLFTGDHVLEGVSPVIVPPDGNMADYLRSLDKLLRREDVERLAPGHGRVMDSAQRVLDALRAHRLAREAKVLRCLAALGEASAAELTAPVYDDVGVERHDWAQLTLQAHLSKLLDEGRVAVLAGRWRVVRT